MKKSYLFVLIALLTCTISFAQSEDSKSENLELKEEFKEIEQDMKDVFGENSQYQIMVDTLMTQDFGDMFMNPNNFQQFNSEEMAQSFEEMFKIFEEQFNSFSENDMKEFEELFEGFNLQEIIIPEQLDENGNPIAPSEKDKKKEKKRTTYKL